MARARPLRTRYRRDRMNVLDIEPGFRVRIKQTFRDFDGRTHLAGTELTLASRELFPHDGGYTLRFTDGTVIRLAEESILGAIRSSPTALAPSSRGSRDDGVANPLDALEQRGSVVVSAAAPAEGRGEASAAKSQEGAKAGRVADRAAAPPTPASPACRSRRGRRSGRRRHDRHRRYRDGRRPDRPRRGTRGGWDRPRAPGAQIDRRDPEQLQDAPSHR